MKKHFVSLQTVLDYLNNSGRVRLEHRPARYKFGCLNYGEVRDDLFNSADGDRWDVFAAGYNRVLPAQTYTVDRVIGVFLLENGNHKIAVTLKDLPVDATRCRREIRRYVTTYSRGMKLAGEWVPS